MQQLADERLNLSNGTVTATFDTLTSTSGAANVVLASINGSVSATASTLSGATGRAIDMNAGTAGLSLPGDITNSGSGIVIAAKTAGVIDLPGVLTINSAASQVGVSVTSPTGATTTLRLPNAANTVTTSGAAALTVTNTKIETGGQRFTMPESPDRK